MSNQKLKNIVEGFLFASDKALNADHIVKMFAEGERPEKKDVVLALEELVLDFASHGVELKKVSTGFRFQVRKEYTQWVSRLWEERPQKYTRALLETLALIVYRQPITRGEIEEIRGVSVSSNIIKTLQEREWIKIVGHRDVPGRPALLASTKQFLDYFNLESLEDLPPLSEIKDLDAIATELDPEQNSALISAIRDMQEAQKTPPTEIETDEVASEKKIARENDQLSPKIESVADITAELDVVLENEKKLENAEEKLEATLNTQVVAGQFDTQNPAAENSDVDSTGTCSDNSSGDNTDSSGETFDSPLINKVGEV